MTALPWSHMGSTTGLSANRRRGTCRSARGTDSRCACNRPRSDDDNDARRRLVLARAVPPRRRRSVRDRHCGRNSTMFPPEQSAIGPSWPRSPGRDCGGNRPTTPLPKDIGSSRHRHTRPGTPNRAARNRKRTARPPRRRQASLGAVPWEAHSLGRKAANLTTGRTEVGEWSCPDNFAWLFNSMAEVRRTTERQFDQLIAILGGNSSDIDHNLRTVTHLVTRLGFVTPICFQPLSLSIGPKRKSVRQNVPIAEGYARKLVTAPTSGVSSGRSEPPLSK